MRHGAATRGNFPFQAKDALFDSALHMPKKRFTAVISSALLCLCGMVKADTVILKSGEKLEGKILSETDAELTMSVQVSATIKDERVVKRDEIEKVLKIQPEEEAWVALGGLVPGADSLERDDYERVKTALQYFINSFPKSGYVPVAKERLDQFIAEQKRVEAGEMKLDGNWLSKEKVKEERVQVAGHILLNRMKRAAAAGQLTEAMAIFDQMEKGFPGAASYPDAIELARRVLPTLKAVVEQRQAQLKRRIEDENQRLKTATGTEKAQLDALIKQERKTTEATIAAAKAAGLKWLPLSPANEGSLSALATLVTAETSRLGGSGLSVEKMRESLKSTEDAASALAKGNLEQAEKTLQSATSAWSANELAKRLQTKLNDAKKAASEKKAPTPAPTPTPKPKSSSGTKPAGAGQSAPATTAQTEEAEEKPGMGKPILYIAIAGVIAIGAIGGKMFMKARAKADGSQGA